MIKKFKLFESRLSDKEIRVVHDICKVYGIRKYTINPDGSISVSGNVDLSSKSLKRIPLNFKEISGDFICHNNYLESLEGCPETVGGYFNCSSNKLTSLQGCPKSVDDGFYFHNNQLTSLEGCPKEVGNFYCYNNYLTSLEGCPEKVGGNFYCYNNYLTSLEGCPKEVGDFDCCNNQLTSLQWCPERVGGSFYCHNNRLTSLEGCPEIVRGDFYCNNNKITSFDGLPEFWEKIIVIHRNPVDEVYVLFKRDPKCIEWIREYDVIQGGSVSKHRLEEVFHTLNLEVPKDIKLINYQLI